MLYKYLFDIHARDSFDWSRFYEHIGFSGSEPLSDTFVSETSEVCHGPILSDAAHARTLADLAEVLRAAHLQLGNTRDELDLVYRWRASSGAFSSPSKSLPRRRKAMKSPKDAIKKVIDLTGEVVSEVIPTDAPAIDLTDSPELPSQDSLGKTDQGAQPHNSPRSQQDARSASPLNITETRQSSMPPAITMLPTTPLNLRDLAAKAEHIQEEAAGSIIGKTTFKYDEPAMLAYLQDAASFWTGRVGLPLGSKVHP